MTRGSRFISFGGTGDRNLGANLLPNHKFEFQLSDTDQVARLQNCLTVQRLTIDSRSIGAAEIAQPNRIVINAEDTVMTTDQIAVRAQMAILFPSHQEFLGREGNGLTLMLATQNS